MKLPLCVNKKNWVYFSKRQKCNFANTVLSLNLTNKFLYIIDMFNYDNNEWPSLALYDDLENINYYKDYADKNHLMFVIILETLAEGASYRYHLKNTIDFIITNTSIKKENFIIFNCAEHQMNDDIKYCTTLLHVTQQINFLPDSVHNIPEYHFISLSRLAKNHRIMSTIEIYERNLEKLGLISLGSGYYSNNNSENKSLEYIPEKYKNIFPLYIDGQVIGNDPSQYEDTTQKMRYAFVNLVQETSFDWGYSPFGNPNYWWCLPFITEKTIKAFAWCQVPIFITCKDHDLYLRRYGFDLFDDIIDHSYNQEDDPTTRIKMAIDQLEKICSWSIEKCSDYKKQNTERFLKNYTLARQQIYSEYKNRVNNLQKTIDLIKEAE
jgi:hypothetical protein